MTDHYRLTNHNCIIAANNKHIGFFVEGVGDDDVNMLYCDVLFVTEALKEHKSPIISTAIQVIII
jgi:hypothetical protein